MRALSIRQPYAELILRGIKTIEYRSRATTIIGERFWIYASKGQVTRGKGQASSGIWSADLAMAETGVPPWMAELAAALRLFPGELPTGVIVGSAVIEKVTPGEANTAGFYHWHLADVQRAKTLRKPKGHPQPVWWWPG